MPWRKPRLIAWHKSWESYLQQYTWAISKVGDIACLLFLKIWSIFLNITIFRSSKLVVFYSTPLAFTRNMGENLALRFKFLNFKSIFFNQVSSWRNWLFVTLQIIHGMTVPSWVTGNIERVRASVHVFIRIIPLSEIVVVIPESWDTFLRDLSCLLYITGNT